MRELICICCPLGCHITVDDSDMNDLKVTGNTCPRGAKYARDEVTCPKRVVTSICPVEGGEIAMVSCKTKDSVEKRLIFEVLKEIRANKVVAPVHEGDVLVHNVMGTGVDVVATKTVLRRHDG